MNALGHYLEDEGLATTGISLIREHTQWMRPPRLLWVPFPLGRPLGRPGDVEFQHRVIAAALALLDADSGPVLADFSEEAGSDEAETAAWTCPVSFAPPPASADRAARLQAELSSLAPWYERARARRGRTTVGASGLDIQHAIGFLIDFCETKAVKLEPPEMLRLTHAAEDLKAYYLEAAAGQPGARNAHAAAHWFWQESEAGTLLFSVAERAAASVDPFLQLLGKRGLVPRWANQVRGSQGRTPGPL